MDIQWLLDRQSRWFEYRDNLPQGSVVGSYEDGEFRFYKFGALAGRIGKGWTTEIIRTWEGIYNEQNR